MRIEIKTKEPVRDPDIKALYLLDYALSRMSTPQMLCANLRYIADKYGFSLAEKGS